MKSCFHQAIFLITESHKEGECQAQELIELIHHHHHGDNKQTSTGITLQDLSMALHLIIMTTIQDLKIDLTHQITNELFLQTRAIIKALTINMEILMTCLKDSLASKALINFKWTTWWDYSTLRNNKCQKNKLKWSISCNNSWIRWWIIKSKIEDKQVQSNIMTH